MDDAAVQRLHDSIDKVCEERDRLRRERDAWMWRTQTWGVTIKRLERERDDLKAQLDDSPLQDAIDLLWRDIILTRRPKYGDWGYGGEAYRHIMHEVRAIEQQRDTALEALRKVVAKGEAAQSQYIAVFNECLGICRDAIAEIEGENDE